MSSATGVERPVAAAAPKPRLPAWLAALLAILLLGGGVGAAVAFVKTKPKPAKDPAESVAPTVEVMVAHLGSTPVRMQLSGQVMAARKLVLMPEVGGRVVWQSPELVMGGMVRAGQPLVRIDARDYALALEQQRAQLASQQLQLDIEQGRRKVAAREWAIYQQERTDAGVAAGQSDDPDAGAPLALRAPHLKSAQVAVGAAKSNIARAKLQLSKTGLSAPFNAFVQTENVETGQLVGPASQLAVLVGTDAFWVRVSVPVSKLDFIELPQGEQPGSPAEVWLDTGHGRVERQGRVVRLLGDLDPVGRMARVLVQIDDPFRLKQSPTGEPQAELASEREGAQSESKLPLLLGAYVHVEIAGVELSHVVELPRRAMREGDRVFTLTAKDELRIVPVQIAWGSDETVAVTGELHEGEQVVLSALAAPVAGMKLRVASAPAARGAGSGSPSGSGRPSGSANASGSANTSTSGSANTGAKR